jgi:Rieske Fe-S protein
MKHEKIESNDNRPELSRRRFLTKVLIGLGALTLVEFIGVALAFLKPRKSSTETDDSVGLVEAGAVEDFLPNSVTTFIRGRFYLVRMEDGGFLAVSGICTHLGCAIRWEADENKFLCPCHSSSFDITGGVISPPATKALDIYPVTIENEFVSVHTGQPIKRTRFESVHLTYPEPVLSN